jgi:hypothetical protein
MQSAPAVIPAMTQASLPAGFTAPDRTFEVANRTRSSSPMSPVCSASDHTGTKPAHDTRLCSSNRAASTDHPCEDLTESAPGNADHRVLDKPDHPSSEGTFPIHTPLTDAIRPRIQAKSFPEDHHWKEAWRSCHCFGWPAAPAGAPAPPAPRWTHATAAPERSAPRATARPTQTQRKIITSHSQLITPDTPKIKLPT